MEDNHCNLLLEPNYSKPVTTHKLNKEQRDEEATSKLCQHLQTNFQSWRSTDLPRDTKHVRFNKSGGLQDRVVDPPQSLLLQTEFVPPPSPPGQDNPPMIGVDF